MMAAGRVVADGTPGEVKAVVSGRRIRASFDFEWTPDIEVELSELPGVRSVEHRGDVLSLVSDDSDAALRTLLSLHQDVHDIEVTAHSMDDAFLALTAAADAAAPSARPSRPSVEPVETDTATDLAHDPALIGDRS
jgi:ABC-2 type transport system ATP-binding protein